MRPGFTLLHVAVLMAVLAVTMVGFLSGSVGNTKGRNFARQAEMIEEKQRAHMYQQGSRLCPSDITLPYDHPNFGRAVAHGASCNAGMTPTDCCIGANFGTAGLVMGGVPVVDLGLPKEAALGPTGNRVFYAVSRVSTQKNVCKIWGANPGVYVRSSVGGALGGAHAGVYLDLGEDAHGAFPGAGGTERRNTGNTNAETLENAGLSETFTDNFNNVFIRRELMYDTSGAVFDDVVIPFDKCCLGPGCL